MANLLTPRASEANASIQRAQRLLFKVRLETHLVLNALSFWCLSCRSFFIVFCNVEVSVSTEAKESKLTPFTSSIIGVVRFGSSFRHSDLAQWRADEPRHRIPRIGRTASSPRLVEQNIRIVCSVCTSTVLSFSVPPWFACLNQRCG